MNRIRFFSSFLPLLLALSLLQGGCAHSDNPGAKAVDPPVRSPVGERNATEPAVQAINAKGIALGPGDVIGITVYGDNQLSGDYDVFEDGSILMPLIGKVTVVNMTPPQAAKVIAEKLGGGYLKNPQVSIVLKTFKSKNVYILGAVKKPGSVPYRYKLTIVQLISEAGGFTQEAAKNDVRLTRRNGGQRKTFLIPVEDITRGEQPDFMLEPGDVVFVPLRIF